MKNNTAFEIMVSALVLHDLLKLQSRQQLSKTTASKQGRQFLP